MKRSFLTMAAAIALVLFPLGNISSAQTATDTGNTTAGTATETAVTVSDNVFTPMFIGIHVGDTVTWTNYGQFLHTVTADDGSFDSGDLSNNQSFSHMFDTAGVYRYHCKHHGAPNGIGMSGTVTVTAAEGSTSTSTVTSNLNTPGSDLANNNVTSPDTGTLANTDTFAGTSTTSTSTMPSTTTMPTETAVTIEAPTNVSATSTSATSIALSWTAPAAPTSSSSTMLSFGVIRNGKQVATTTDTSYNDQNLTPDTTYAYNVNAFDSAGNYSAWSPTIFAATPSGTATTSTPGTSTSTPSGSGAVWGWAAIPLSVFNIINGTASSSTSTTSSSPYTYNNGYPTLNGNYVDCNGNIDNDMTHHTTDSNDTDPGHHIGMSCPNGGMPLVYGQQGQSSWPSMPMQSGSGAPQNFIVSTLNGSGGVPWVMVPLTSTTLQKIMDAMNNHPDLQPMQNSIMY